MRIKDAYMEKMPVVSVVIPVYNRAEECKRCVQSILKSTYRKLEIIVVDDCSTDATAEEMVCFVSRLNTECMVRIIRNKVNLGLAGARNTGIDEATGEYICFVDSDNCIDPDMISFLAADLYQYKRAGFVTALTINVDEKNRQTVSSRINTISSVLMSRQCNVFEKEVRKVFRTGCCENVCMIRREVVECIGYYDRSYGIMYEDSDYCKRAEKAGFDLLLDARARTIHYRARTTDENDELRALGLGTPKRAYLFAKNRTKYMKKFGEILPIYFMIFMNLFLIFY